MKAYIHRVAVYIFTLKWIIVGLGLGLFTLTLPLPADHGPIIRKILLVHAADEASSPSN